MQGKIKTSGSAKYWKCFDPQILLRKKKHNPIKEITKPMNKRYKKMVKEITKS